MRKILSIFTLLTLTTPAMAAFGTPDQDPIVNNLRDRFKHGIQPVSADLLNHTYKCKEMAAGRNDYRKVDSGVQLKFAQFDGYLAMEWSNTRSNGQYLVENGKELLTSMNIGDNQISTLAFRVDSKDFLVGEFSYTNPPSIAELEPVSAAVSGSKVTSYILCVPIP